MSEVLFAQQLALREKHERIRAAEKIAEADELARVKAFTIQQEAARKEKEIQIHNDNVVKMRARTGKEYMVSKSLAVVEEEVHKMTLLQKQMTALQTQFDEFKSSLEQKPLEVIEEFTPPGTESDGKDPVPPSIQPQEETKPVTESEGQDSVPPSIQSRDEEVARLLKRLAEIESEKDTTL